MLLQRLAIATMLTLCVLSCERVVIERVGDDGDATGIADGEDGAYDKGTISSDTASIDYLTVAEAQLATVGEAICVRGYVVASCYRAMSNADFLPPFEGSTAIILADEPVDTVDFQYATDEYLFPVCLTDYKDVRAALNMEDNPQLWNRPIYVMGVKARYMGCPGLKKVFRYQLAW